MILDEYDIRINPSLDHVLVCQPIQVCMYNGEIQKVKMPTGSYIFTDCWQPMGNALVNTVDVDAWKLL